MMNADSLKEAVRRELPNLLRADPEFRAYVLEVARREFMPRGEIVDRFDRLLDELKRDREAQARKWEEQRAESERDRTEQARKWEEQRAESERDRAEQARKWEEQRAESEHDRAEQARKWEEQRAESERDRAEQARKWEEQRAKSERDREEQNRKWDEQNRKWEEGRKEFDRVHEEIMAQAKKFDRSIGALGARWGMQSEAAFRNALAGILEQNFGVQVININEYDEEGIVFGRPEQVELDVIIKNGPLLICELKSSMSKSDMYTFERKVRFYEQRHGRKAERLIVISPMIDAKAEKAAQRLGIQTYSDSEDVESI